MYCISEFEHHEDEEEEGLEVIGLGRYNTMAGEDTTESFKEEMLRLADSTDSLEVDDRLSQMFTSSSNNNRIKVAYYRPSLDDDHDNTNKLKEE
jgi:hypothetical protein